MKQNNRYRAVFAILAGMLFLRLCGCGQTDLEIPGTSWSGTCDTWYPQGGDAASDEIYGFKEGDILPCAVFESARLNGEDTYINFGDIYLDADHGLSDVKSIALVISAKNCPSCAVLIQDLADLADDIDAAGAVMVSIIFCDNTDRTDCDFDIDKAEAAAAEEGWPVDRWFVTNDAEGLVRPLYQDTFPTTIVARVSDMKIISVNEVPDAESFLDLIETF